MRESFVRTARVEASPARVWEVLHDTNLLSSLSSHLGAVRVVEPGRAWEVSLKDRVGVLTLSAPMQVEILEETDEATISVRAFGQDRGPGTRLIVEATIRLDQTDAGTELNMSGWFELIGKVAMLGAGVARRQAGKMIDEFWSNLTKGLQT
ncbi:MAG TPA: SRPBCC family protein [Acidimicrobiia bacterium]|nr:SRPBCC family protein [Acidimicrobiia bacterium]